MSYIKEGISAYTTNIFGDTNNKIVKFNREFFDVNNYHSTIYDQSKFYNTSNIPKFYLVIYTISDKNRDIRLNNSLETYIFKNGKTDDRYCYYCSNGNLTHTAIDVIYLEPEEYIELYVGKIFGSSDIEFKTIIDLYEIGNVNDTNIKLSFYNDDVFNFAVKADKTKTTSVAFNKSVFDNHDLTTLNDNKIYNNSNKAKCFIVSYYLYFQTDLYVDNFNDNRHNRFFRNFWISINGNENIRYANSCSRDSTISKLDIIILKPGDYIELKGYIHSLPRREDRALGNIHKWTKYKIHLYETSNFVPTRPEQLLLFYDDKKIELKNNDYIDIPINLPCYTMKNKKLVYDNDTIICMNDIESIYLINYQFYQETNYDCVYTSIHSYLLKNNEIYGSYIGSDLFINISCIIQLKKGDILKLRCLGNCNVKNAQGEDRKVYINSENIHHNSKLNLPLSVKYPKIQILELGEI